VSNGADTPLAVIIMLVVKVQFFFTVTSSDELQEDKIPNNKTVERINIAFFMECNFLIVCF